MDKQTGISPDTFVYRFVGECDLHIARDGQTAWCNATFNDLPLMTVGDMAVLDLKRTCPTCNKALVGAGLSLPSDTLPGWHSRPGG